MDQSTVLMVVSLVVLVVDLGFHTQSHMELSLQHKALIFCLISVTSCKS